MADEKKHTIEVSDWQMTLISVGLHAIAHLAPTLIGELDKLDSVSKALDSHAPSAEEITAHFPDDPELLRELQRIMDCDVLEGLYMSMEIVDTLLGGVSIPPTEGRLH